jgi:Rps23 Pro-64 3,4-dihydroxylase Tpa1-like proline 4-hydroxylase
MISFEKSSISIIDDFLSPERAEMVFNLVNSDIKWKKMSNKENRFSYHFSQNEDYEVIKNVLSVSDFISEIEKITGFDEFSIPIIFLTKYELNDYLSPHNDNADDREYGFIYNVTKDACIENGGVLHYINDKNEYEPILPKYNRLVMFKVENSGMHFVSKVEKNGYKRLALTGWINTKKFDKRKKEKTLI